MGQRETEKRLTREFSAGGVVFKKEKGEVLWLVCKSTPGKAFPKGFWRLPKGWLDDEKDGLSPGPLARGERRATEQEIEKAALREVEEEGGVKARIVKKIGTARWFMGREGLKFVTFYLMEWVKDLPQGFGFETSEIRWLPSEEAKKTISNNREREVLDRADALLASGIQESLV